MDEIRGLSKNDIWDYENGYWWFSDPSRFGKSLAHAELYKKILDLPGTVAEFGVYKANSLIRWLTLRDVYESQTSRKILGFDSYGDFPGEGIEAVESDVDFIPSFHNIGGGSLSLEQVDWVLKEKGFRNYELVKGDVRETLVDYLKKSPHEQFCLINLDMDVYEPTAYVLDMLLERVIPGGVVIIDDFNTVEGATKATRELLLKHPEIKLKKTQMNYIPTYFVK